MSGMTTRPRRGTAITVRDDGPTVQFASAPPPTGTVTLTFSVSALLHERLSESARAARQSLGSFAAMLLGTAYHASLRPTGTPAVDTAVARAVILSRTHNTAEIATAVGLSEAAVTRILGAWRDEVDAGRAA